MTDINANTILDQIYHLQQQCNLDILRLGETFKQSWGTPEFKATVNSDSTLYADPTATVARFGIISTGLTDYLVSGAEKQAGRQLVHGGFVSGRALVHSCRITTKHPTTQQHIYFTSVKHSNLPYIWKNSQMFVQPGAVSVGDMVTLSGSRFEVASKTIMQNGLDRLQLTPRIELGAVHLKSTSDSFASDYGNLTCQNRQFLCAG